MEETMAKENKQDRLVRQMMDNMTEQFHELKSLDSHPGTKESDVEKWAQTFLKTCLGYSVTNGYTIRCQEQKGKHRPDLIVYQGETPIFVVEVKKLGFDLDKSDFRSGKVQLGEYLHTLGKVPYGFLCNGFEWRLYDFNNSLGVVEMMSYDLKGGEDKFEFNKKFIEEMCYEFTNFHESTFRAKEWPEFAKEATAFSPESLTKAILSANVVKLISREIRGEHDYKANLDSLYHKIYDLLAKGLDDSVKDFEGVKNDEFQKFMKTQMKVMRKAKKVTKPTVDNQVMHTTDAEATQQTETEAA